MWACLGSQVNEFIFDLETSAGRQKPKQTFIKLLNAVWDKKAHFLHSAVRICTLFLHVVVSTQQFSPFPVRSLKYISPGNADVLVMIRDFSHTAGFALWQVVLL